VDDAEPEPTPEVGGSDVAVPPGPTRPDSDKLTPRETLLLYALMEARCARCKTRVVRESETSGKAFSLGKRAHMVGRSEAGPLR
jgi:hypothetical protein